MAGQTAIDFQLSGAGEVQGSGISSWGGLGSWFTEGSRFAAVLAGPFWGQFEGICGP